jgi:hypothetical protein
MTLRCIRCKKPLRTAAAQAGAYAWGPKCARQAGLIQPRKRGRKAGPAPRTETDVRQMALELAT